MLPAPAVLHGVPESRLAAAVLDQLPASTPGAPWPCRVEAVLWWHRAVPAAALAVDPALRDLPTVGLTVGAVLRYLDTPVGAYDEVLACPVLLRPGGRGSVPQVHVPFIAVDSVPSVHGGRTHWALPKTTAAFRRRSASGAGAGGVSAVGDGWAVDVVPHPRGPSLPVAGRFRVVQVGPAGRQAAPSSARGRARLASVQVRVRSDHAGEPGSIAQWLLPGRHRGAVLTGVRLTVGAP